MTNIWIYWFFSEISFGKLSKFYKTNIYTVDGNNIRTFVFSRKCWNFLGFFLKFSKIIENFNKFWKFRKFIEILKFSRKSECTNIVSINRRTSAQFQPWFRLSSGCLATVSCAAQEHMPLRNSLPAKPRILRKLSKN